MKIEKLLKLSTLTPINQLTREQVRELQNALNELGYDAGPADGLPGARTRSGWLQLMADTFGSNLILIGPDAAKLLAIKLSDQSGDSDDGAPVDDGSDGPIDPPSTDLGMKLTLLPKINNPLELNELRRDQLRELQTALYRLGYPVGDIDGLYGNKTRGAWGEFEADVFGGNKLLVGPVSIDMLQKRLDVVGGGRSHDFSTKEGTIEAIKWECDSQEIGLKTQIAYVLATVEWETARTFKPVREAFWLSEEWRRDNLRYHPYYGRGFVQITWEKNYQRYSEILGVDLVNEPDRAMEENIALFILVHGFKTGVFTGRKISDYISGVQTDYVNARRCINGTDHAQDIADLAEKYFADL